MKLSFREKPAVLKQPETEAELSAEHPLREKPAPPQGCRKKTARHFSCECLAVFFIMKGKQAASVPIGMEAAFGKVCPIGLALCFVSIGDPMNAHAAEQRHQQKNENQPAYIFRIDKRSVSAVCFVPIGWLIGQKSRRGRLRCPS